MMRCSKRVRIDGSSPVAGTEVSTPGARLSCLSPDYPFVAARLPRSDIESASSMVTGVDANTSDPPAPMWQAFDPLAPPFLAKDEPPGTGTARPIGIFPSKKRVPSVGFPLENGSSF